MDGIWGGTVGDPAMETAKEAARDTGVLVVALAVAKALLEFGKTALEKHRARKRPKVHNSGELLEVIVPSRVGFGRRLEDEVRQIRLDLDAHLKEAAVMKMHYVERQGVLLHRLDDLDTRVAELKMTDEKLRVEILSAVNANTDRTIAAFEKVTDQLREDLKERVIENQQRIQAIEHDMRTIPRRS